MPQAGGPPTYLSGIMDSAPYRGFGSLPFVRRAVGRRFRSGS